MKNLQEIPASLKVFSNANKKKKKTSTCFHNKDNSHKEESGGRVLSSSAIPCALLMSLVFFWTFSRSHKVSFQSNRHLVDA